LVDVSSSIVDDDVPGKGVVVVVNMSYVFFDNIKAKEKKKK
jgi:hypothetical protein